MINYYCINLLRRKDRWDRMAALAAERGIALTQVLAIDATATDFAAKAAHLKRKGPTGILGDGAVACTLSHVKAWQAFVDSGQDHAVFLEDDVELSDDFAATVAAIIGAQPGFDLIKLECSLSAKDGILLGPPVFEMKRRRLRPCYQLSTDAAAYILSREGARHALSRIGQSDVAVDHFLFYPLDRTGNCGLPFAYVEPSIAIQDRGLQSNIASARYADSAWSRKLRRLGYEAAPAGTMISALLFKGARVIKPPYQA